MVVAWAALALGTFTAPQEDSPWLRTVLPTGAIVVAHSLPEAKRTSAQLLLSARSWPESPANHGWRHLWEHLTAAGPNGDLDIRLESAGMTLRARTFRDANQFEIECAPAQLDAALDALLEILRPRAFSPATLAKELEILRHERALMSVPERLSSKAWLLAYGEEGIDTQGSEEALRGATPADMERLHSELCDQSKVTISLAGPQPAELMIQAAKSALAPIAPGKPEPPQRRQAGAPAKGFLPGVDGGVLAALTGSFDSREAAATLAAGLALAAHSPGSFFIYTPSAENSLILVGGTDSWPELLKAAEDSNPDSAARRFEAGVDLARRWVRRQLADPTSSAFLRGYLASGAFGMSPEKILGQLDRLTLADFRQGWAAFGADQRVEVRGGQP